VLKTSELLKTVGLKLLARREHSVCDFRKKLLAKFPEHSELVEEVVQEFVEKDWLSDERFCEAFIHDQVLFFKTGPLKIIQKLRLKGISEAMAKRKTQECFLPEQQQEIALDLANKKQDAILRSAKKPLTEFEIRQKKQQYLFQKGFCGSHIQEIF